MHYKNNGLDKIFLLNVKKSQKTISTVLNLYDKTVNILWIDGFMHNDVLLFLSYVAPYMIKSAIKKNLVSYFSYFMCTCACIFPKIGRSQLITDKY